MKKALGLLRKTFIFLTSVYILGTLFIGVHELSHYYTARHFGFPITKITINNGLIFAEVPFEETTLRLGLNVFAGGEVKLEDKEAAPETANFRERLAVNLAPTLVVPIFFTLVFIGLRIFTKEQLTVSDKMKQLTSGIKNQSLRLWYSSFIAIAGIVIVLPGLILWNSFFNQKDTYKMFFLKREKNHRLAAIGIYFLTICLYYQTINTWPLQLNDISIIPLIIIAQDYAFSQWGFVVIYLSLSFVPMIIFVWAIHRLSKRERVKAKIRVKNGDLIEFPLYAGEPIVIRINRANLTQPS